MNVKPIFFCRKRSDFLILPVLSLSRLTPVSYTHLDVYKRQIEWKVADRFRLFNADEIAKQIKADDNKSAADILLDSLNADLQKNAGEEIIYPKIRDFLLQNNQFEQTAWQASGFEADGKVKASRKYRDDYLYPQGYNVRARLASQYIQTGDNCLWQIIGESEICLLYTSRCV